MKLVDVSEELLVLRCSLFPAKFTFVCSKLGCTVVHNIS